jgi:hypothetical protein
MTTIPYPISIWKKLNPIWWLLNSDDPIEDEPQMWPDKSLWLRHILWFLRNPAANFMCYIIGVKDYSPIAIGFEPNSNWRSDGRKFKWLLIHPTRGWKRIMYLPFASYRGSSIEWYVGWRHDGLFGISLRKSNSH